MNNESLWANIQKKRERIKRGSGERMRKKGEKGAPTPAQLKRAKSEEVTSTASVAGAGDNPQKIVPVHMKKRKKDREKILRRFIENRNKNEAKMRERVLEKYRGQTNRSE